MIELLVVKFSPFCCYLLPFMTVYLALEQPKHMFLPHYVRPSFTPTSNKN